MNAIPCFNRLSLLNRSVRNALLTTCGVVAVMNVSYAQDTEELPSATLDTITITARSGGITPKINQQVVEKSTILDMKDVLEDQPSLSVSGGNGVAQQLYLRNFGENEISFIVDGVPTDSPVFHHQSKFMFDPALLKHLEVQKGTGSASSGIGVTAGAIRMTTVDADDMLDAEDNVGAMIGGGFSSNDGWHATVAAYGRSDAMASGGTIDGIIMANQVEQKNYDDGHGEEIPYTAMTQQAYLAKFGWNINQDNRLVLSHRHEANSGDFGLRSNLIGDYGNQPVYDTETSQDTTILSYEGYDLGKQGIEVKANAYVGESKDERNLLTTAPPFLRNISSHIHKQGADLSVLYPIGNHDLVSGINYRNNESKANKFPSGLGVEKKTEYGVFTEMRWNLNPVTLTTGVRYDDYKLTNNAGKTNSDSLISPSVAATWDVNNNLSFNAKWSQAIHSPRAEESLLLTLGRFNQLADDLRPGKAQTAEVGFEWQGDNGLMLGASVYDQRIKDFIRSKYAGGVGTLTNVGELRNKGYEANIGYRDANIKAFFGMSHNEPKLNGEYHGYALEAIPTGTKYNASFSYRFNQPQIELGVKYRYVDEYIYREAGETVDRTAPDYFITDVFANWQPFANDKLSINVGVNNLTDKKYYNQSNFRSSRFGVNDYSNWNPEKGREYRVGVNYKF